MKTKKIIILIFIFLIYSTNCWSKSIKIEEISVSYEDFKQNYAKYLRKKNTIYKIENINLGREINYIKTDNYESHMCINLSSTSRLIFNYNDLLTLNKHINDSLLLDLNTTCTIWIKTNEQTANNLSERFVDLIKIEGLTSIDVINTLKQEIACKKLKENILNLKIDYNSLFFNRDENDEIYCLINDILHDWEYLSRPGYLTIINTETNKVHLNLSCGNKIIYDILTFSNPDDPYSKQICKIPAEFLKYAVYNDLSLTFEIVNYENVTINLKEHLTNDISQSFLREVYSNDYSIISYGYGNYFPLSGFEKNLIIARLTNNLEIELKLKKNYEKCLEVYNQYKSLLNSFSNVEWDNVKNQEKLLNNDTFESNNCYYFNNIYFSETDEKNLLFAYFYSNNEKTSGFYIDYSNFSKHFEKFSIPYNLKCLVKPIEKKNNIDTFELLWILND